MNKKNLQKYLKRKKVPQICYSLEGGLPNEKYCIEENEGKWHVYYSERGGKSGLAIFSDEETACKTFVNVLRKDGLLK